MGFVNKGMGRDETTSSMVSDTWSMDVLASDNEILDQSDRSQISVQLPPPPPPPPQQANSINQQVSTCKIYINIFFFICKVNLFHNKCLTNRNTDDMC